MGLIDDLQASIDAYNNKIEDNREKIRRLKVTKTDLADAKETIETYKDNWAKVAENFSLDTTWQGSKKTYEIYRASDAIATDYTTYITNIDSALDAVIEKITTLENEIIEWQGAIGWLAARINSLLSEIEQALN
ncbi:protein of unknown function [Pseudobutyrivibrio sp. YE44]|uniref:YwqH-like family protein n=1 Tax=Pseudobutyrivibrio sp. YE44 TaxID=1520802 RepID=UPI00088E65EF|nr:DUF5082 family protein [Pseudobutyrivibrio sp. YE44]SDB40071.1 protein of unknown function [Pseudobutyrivibrio sp. YE44]